VTFGGPAPVGVGQAFAAPEAVDDGLDLQEFGLRILLVGRAGERAGGGRAQVLLKVAHFGVRTGLRDELDEAAGVVVDGGERLVDEVHPLLDRLSFAGELGVEVGDLVDGVDVQELLEARLEARQVVALQAGEQAFILRQCRECNVHFGRLGLELLLETAHGIDDALGKARQALVLHVDASLQPVAQLLLAVVA